MATLKSIFEIVDKFTAPINRMISQTDKLTNKILGASGNSDKLNNSLKNTGSTASSSSLGIMKLAGAYFSLQGIVKGFSIVDEYTNSSARLDLINDGLQTQAQLQEKIFQSAKRSRSEYTDTVDAISKLGLLASDSFGSTEETIAFTELLNKSFALSGASGSEKSGALTQLTQAMASGKLQGDEFRSITENAPMLVQAIADYMKISKGELKELSSEGLITSDIIKNALFGAADDINAKFETMPKTFGSVWTEIKNGVLQNLQPVMQQLNSLINTEQFNNTVNVLIGGISLLASWIGNALEFAVNFANVVSDNWGIIEPILWGIIGALIVYNVVSVITNSLLKANALMEGIAAASKMMMAKSTFVAAAAQEGLNAALLACPLTWIIIAIIAIIILFYAVIGAINKFAGTSISATGIIAGVFMVALAFIGNLFITFINLIIDCVFIIWDAFATFAEFFANVFNDPIGSVIRLFAGMADSVLGILETIASAIDTLFGSNLANAVSGWRGGLQGMVNDLVGEAKIKVERFDSSDYHLDRFDYGNAYDTGYNFGSNVSDKFSMDGLLGDLGNSLNGFDMSEFGTSNNPLSVKGTDSNGSLDVNIGDEDLKYMRDIAEREYINKFSTKTLAPQIKITTGDIRETVDADNLLKRMAKLLKEEIETAPEGVV